MGAITHRRSLDIASPYLLMVAAQAIAQRLGAQGIAGVSGALQLQRVLGDGNRMYFSYDRLWLTHGGLLTADDSAVGLYEIPIPFAQPPLSELRCGHRSRNRRKRRFKAQLAEAVTQRFDALVCGAE